jgi:hypothetical protein
MEKLTRTINVIDACAAAFLITIGKRCHDVGPDGFKFDESCQEDIQRYAKGAMVGALDFARESTRCIRIAKDLRAKRKLASPLYGPPASLNQ